jgi:hypothetical protein
MELFFSRQMHTTGSRPMRRRWSVCLQAERSYLPLHFPDIPADTVTTYVNPVCSENLNDDAETLKLRTRITIEGDSIDYSYDKSAVTANMEALKLLINAMIPEDAQWSTIDISDFYLGTPLPHPEYIRIQRALIHPAPRDPVLRPGEILA